MVIWVFLLPYPAETLANVYDQLKNDGKVKRGWLGVFIQEVDQDLAKSFGMDKPKGAVIAKILDKSPAQKADFQQGDVILMYDGKDVLKVKRPSFTSGLYIS